MTIIDRDTVKANLGITDSTYDTQIDAQIPIIDAKVKQITNNNWSNQISMNLVSGVKYAEIWGVWYWWGGKRNFRDRLDPLMSEIVGDIPTGTYFEGEGIPRTYVTEGYYDYPAEFGGVTYSNPFILLADAATSTTNGAQGFYGWNKAYDSVVSKGVWWLIQDTSTTITDGSWQSKSYGPVSVTKGSGGDTKMDLKSGMPLWFVKALPRYH